MPVFMIERNFATKLEVTPEGAAVSVFQPLFAVMFCTVELEPLPAAYHRIVPPLSVTV